MNTAVKVLPELFNVGDSVQIKIFPKKSTHATTKYMIAYVNHDKDYPYGIMVETGSVFLFKPYELKKL